MRIYNGKGQKEMQEGKTRTQLRRRGVELQRKQKDRKERDTGLEKMTRVIENKRESSDERMRKNVEKVENIPLTYTIRKNEARKECKEMK